MVRILCSRPLAGLLCLLVVLTSVAIPNDTVVAQQSVRSGIAQEQFLGTGREVQLTPFATIELPSGGTVSFYGIDEVDGSTRIGVLQRVARGTRGVLSDARLRGANPREIFNAVAEPGTPLPAQLAHSSSTDPTMGPQGWLRNAVRTPQAASNMCNSATFQDRVESWNFETKLLRLNERPVDHPERWVAYHDGLGLPGDAQDWTWYRYKAQVNTVDLFFTAVAVCALDYHPTFCSTYGSCYTHVGPKIVFQGYNPANQTYHTVVAKDVSTVGEYYEWQFYTGPNWNWTTKVELARPYDKFHIGLTWSDF